MSTTATQTLTVTPFEEFLRDHDEAGWAEVIAGLLPAIHEVDQSATQIWFAFYPLELFRELEQAEDPEALMRELLMQGNYFLKDQVDSSHRFLYGHRFWPAVKKAVAEHAERWHERQATAGGVQATNAELADHIRTIAREVAEGLQVDQSLLIGITAVAFMTIRQAGLEAFRAAPGKVLLDARQIKKSPAQILKKRAKDDSQGVLGFLKTVDKKWTVTFDETDESAHYKMNNMQDLAWGAAEDHTRDWRAIDPRRGEGPIPVECRSAACGTCWVGVLGGAEKLAEVGTRESTRIKEFGYINSTEAKPLIRLACQAQAQGAVSIVIPPWNGFFGKYFKAKKLAAAGKDSKAPTILRGKIQNKET
jgi:ferredoxin